jgi:hypothetical protein
MLSIPFFLSPIDKNTELEKKAVEVTMKNSLCQNGMSLIVFLLTSFTFVSGANATYTNPPSRDYTDYRIRYEEECSSYLFYDEENNYLGCLSQGFGDRNRIWSSKKMPPKKCLSWCYNGGERKKVIPRCDDFLALFRRAGVLPPKEFCKGRDGKVKENK